MDQVKAMLASLRENYLRDLPGHIDEIEQILLELEREGFELSMCRELYRQVHTLKGSGGTYGLDFLSDICHPFEDLLSAIIETPMLTKQGAIELGLKYVDLMRKTCFVYSMDSEPSADLKLNLHALRQTATKNSHSALIVEGSEVVLGMIKDALKDYGCRVEVARDGYAALGRMLSEPFDLLITGLENKRLNGLALISAVQKSGSRSGKTKTILLTTNPLTSNADLPDYVVRKNAELKVHFRQIVDEIFLNAKKAPPP
ncbi:Hpt domain-containing protein [Undibacterium sp. LX40W]|uniref:Hpt domain-containing protein n=1 Tax=Undibacterium nitidum TaxID=2762298 RepID=A0A923HR19_9BURK|nr:MULTISPECIES: Hpt domain-containing protein [Undibacterium]MBC3882383.1 Hpt domain-containing protein [Undibacterium nitidum]MBC3892664.1 Hpt domain-containing protein [Undibacterium sp. LX40W]